MSFLMRSCAAVILAVMCVGVPLGAAQAPASGQGTRQSDYIPIDQLPPQDQLPAAPLLIAAYSFVLIVFFLYVLSLARRMTSVQRDVDRLGAALKHSSKP